ncbi:MAG: TetR/AcrR family transcriptional regulator, partial [Eubacteriaceae bacterium]|nr:TetR/AcrR family transcriptional regulator [Eubacteriaceae bacterium]
MQTKQKIYEIAKILFLQEGYNKVTNKKISEVSGINQGLITYYFKHKSNIASTIIKENYQILSAYLRGEIDVNKEPFLFNITIDNLMTRLMEPSEDFTRFVNEMIEHNVIIESLYTGSQKNDILIMIKKLMPESKENLNKYFRKFVAMTFPAASQFQKEISMGTDFSFDEYYETMVRLFAFALKLDFDDETIT